jgi:preprotein translocase subunit SecF
MSPRRGRGGDQVPEGAGTNGTGELAPEDGSAPEEELEQEAALELEEEFDEELAFAAEEEDEKARGEKPHNILIRLYRGETSFDFIGRRKLWFAASAFVIVLGIISLTTRGLNLGIDFKGGQSWLVSSQNLTVAQATTAAESAGLTQPTVVQLTNQITHQRQIEVTADLNSKPLLQRQAIETKVTDAMAKVAHTTPNNVDYNEVGATWGREVTTKAIQALIVFFILVTIYISIRFEFKMAVAAIVAVFHDILVTVGIYSLTGFQVTPDTVVAVLTVLGYSLYDTVVVFDRIRDNSQGLGASGRITYSEMVNLSMNQTLARSINTSLVAIVPVLSVLVVGSFILGAASLQSFGLALVIGLTSGAYSSIFIASPLLAYMKEREPRYITIRQRLEARGERGAVLTPATAAAMAGATGGGGRGAGKGRNQTTGVIRPGAASTARRTGSGTRKGGGTGVAVPTGAAAASSSEGAPAATGTSRAASGSTRPGGTRPPPRPRKGKGSKGGKGKRR